MSASEESVLQEWRARIAAASAARRPVRLRGAGTKDFYGETLAGDILDLTPWRGIVDYEPSELVITARCGTPLSELEAALETRGQFLAFEPPGFGADPTIGGVVAAGLSGPRRPYAGAARDFVLGARLLTGGGELLRFGGKVMKNVAGFDIPRLLCGSLGILGVITEVSLKVMPRPRDEQTVRLEMSADDAVAAFSRWSAKPLPLSAAAWCEGAALLRLSGAASAVRAARQSIGGERMEDDASRDWWRRLRHCRLPAFSRDVLWRVSLPPAAPGPAIATEPLIDWGGAVRWYADPDPGTDVRALASEAGGTALCWRGSAPHGRFHPLAPAVARLHRRLKERFDPHGILNPGRLLGAL